MKKVPQKMILVDEELHRQLLITKSMKSFKSLSDVIKYYVDLTAQSHSS
jgi:predicted CopG family antitoxin